MKTREPGSCQRQCAESPNSATAPPSVLVTAYCVLSTGGRVSPWNTLPVVKLRFFVARKVSTTCQDAKTVRCGILKRWTLFTLKLRLSAIWRDGYIPTPSWPHAKRLRALGGRATLQGIGSAFRNWSLTSVVTATLRLRLNGWRPFSHSTFWHLPPP